MFDTLSQAIQKSIFVARSYGRSLDKSIDCHVDLPRSPKVLPPGSAVQPISLKLFRMQLFGPRGIVISKHTATRVTQPGACDYPHSLGAGGVRGKRISGLVEVRPRTADPTPRSYHSFLLPRLNPMQRASLPLSLAWHSIAKSFPRRASSR